MNEIAKSPYATRYNNAERAEQQKQCYELRLAHYTYRQIAEITGLSLSTVHQRINDELAETVSPWKEQYKAMARERMDGMSRTVVELLEKRHYMISDGRIVKMDGQPVEDDEFVLKCIDRLMKIETQRAAMEGYNAAVKVDATVTETTQVDIALAELVREAELEAAAELARMRGVNGADAG